jgi:hypothetical protein
MGLFDRFSAKKPASGPAAPTGADPAGFPPVAASPAAPPPPADIRQRLNGAREKLLAKDVAGAIAVYEEVLGVTGDRPDVLLTISGDLGSNGYVAPIIELISPRYDAQRHGPAIGFNLLQAYLAVGNTDAAQHVLDMLFSLNRPDLEARLFGFSNAIVEITAQAALGGPVGGAPELTHDLASPVPIELEPGLAPAAPRVALVSISKPIWFYGLEAMADRVLPPKREGLRRVAFAQLAQLGVRPGQAADGPAEDEVGRLARALPLWLAETFYFSQQYSPSAAMGYLENPGGGRRPMVFTSEWMTDNLRQLLDTTKEGLDFVFTGALKQQAGDYEVILRVWEMKKFRERKLFTARWTPATADAELQRLHGEIRQFMEWAAYPAGAGLAYAPPAAPRPWLEALGASLGLFLADKGVFPREMATPPAAVLAALAPLAAADPRASLAWLTLQARARALGVAGEGDPLPALSPDPVVAEAGRVLGLE